MVTGLNPSYVKFLIFVNVNMVKILICVIMFMAIIIIIIIITVFIFCRTYLGQSLSMLNLSAITSKSHVITVLVTDD